MYRTVILPVFYGCETWSLRLREEHRLRVFGNRVLSRISGPKGVGGRAWLEAGEDCMIRSFISSKLHQKL